MRWQIMIAGGVAFGLLLAGSPRVSATELHNDTTLADAGLNPGDRKSVV